MIQSILAGIMITLVAGLYLVIVGSLGANYCIDDMIYTFIAATDETFVPAATAISYITIGNAIGYNILPYSMPPPKK